MKAKHILIFIFLWPNFVNAQERICDLKVRMLFPQTDYIFKSPGEDSCIFSIINQGPDTIISEDRFLYELWMNGYYYPLRSAQFGRNVSPGDSIVVRTTIKQIALGDIPNVIFCINRLYAWNMPDFVGRKVKSETKEDSSFLDNKDCVNTSLVYQSARVKNVVKSETVLYPNPSTIKLFVSSPLGFEKVKIFDSYGRQQLDSKLIDNEIDIQFLPEGFYYIQLTNAAEMKVVLKFMKHN